MYSSEGMDWYEQSRIGYTQRVIDCYRPTNYPLIDISRKVKGGVVCIVSTMFDNEVEINVY